MGRTAMDVYVTEPTRDHRHVTEPTHDHRRLAAAVEESQDLLRHAAQAGIAVPEDIVGALVHAKSCLDSGLVPERAAVAFHIAFTALAAKVSPVTVDTLRTSDEKTRRSLRRHGVLSVALAVVVVLFSGISSVTSSMSKDIESGIAHANELAVQLRSQVGAPKPRAVQANDCSPAVTAPDPPIPFKDEKQLITELQDFSAETRTMLRTATKLDFFVAEWETSPLAWTEWRKTAWERLELKPDLLNMRQDSFCKIATYQ